MDWADFGRTLTTLSDENNLLADITRTSTTSGPASQFYGPSTFWIWYLAVRADILHSPGGQENINYIMNLTVFITTGKDSFYLARVKLDMINPPEVICPQYFSYANYSVTQCLGQGECQDYYLIIPFGMGQKRHTDEHGATVQPARRRSYSRMN